MGVIKEVQGAININTNINSVHLMHVKMSIYDFPLSQIKCHRYYVCLLCTAVGEGVSVSYLF